MSEHEYEKFTEKEEAIVDGVDTVSYTHLTLPTSHLV